MKHPSPLLVTTIIPVFNRAAMLERAVESVLAQSYRSIEIIIVDDGSTDNTALVADQLGERHAEFIRVIHIENSGPGKAREVGRNLANGGFIQYLDSDDWLLPNKFSDQLAVLKDVPDADIVYGVTQLVNSRGEVVTQKSKDTGIQRKFLFPALLYDRWWHTSTPIYSKRISDLAGAWLDRRPEDWDLEARMGAHSPRLAYVPNVVSCHLDHDDPLRVSKGDVDAYLRDEAWFLPRLVACAIKSGVGKESSDMQQFSKRAFMRARHLGRIGETELASAMFRLSMEVVAKPSAYQLIAQALAPLIGWKMLGTLGHLAEKIS